MGGLAATAGGKSKDRKSGGEWRNGGKTAKMENRWS